MSRRRYKLNAKASKKPAITVTRAALGDSAIVYVGCVNKPLRYRWGRSRVVYIGRTQVGAGRVAVSATAKARELLEERGLRTLEFYPVWPERRPNVRSWHTLEADLLFEFRQTYGELPRCNKRLEARWQSGRFSQRRLRLIIARYSEAV